jgi:hypothetical protein
MDDRDVTARVWESVHFDLDETCFGYVLRDDEGVVYTYERSVLGAASRRLAPCFSRREHAQLFASQWPDRPTLGEGPSYDLGALRDALEARDEGTTETPTAAPSLISERSRRRSKTPPARSFRSRADRARGRKTAAARATMGPCSPSGSPTVCASST